MQNTFEQKTFDTFCNELKTLIPTITDIKIYKPGTPGYYDGGLCCRNVVKKYGIAYFDQFIKLMNYEDLPQHWLD